MRRGFVMAFAKKTFTPEQIKAARLLYENLQTPLDEVAASLKITRRTLEARIAEWGWPPRVASPRNGGRARNELSGRRAKRTRTARKQPKSKARPRPDTTRRPVGSREALAVRVQRVVERELDAIRFHFERARRRRLDRSGALGAHARKPCPRLEGGDAARRAGAGIRTR